MLLLHYFVKFRRNIKILDMYIKKNFLKLSVVILHFWVFIDFYSKQKRFMTERNPKNIIFKLIKPYFKVFTISIYILC